MTNPLTLYKMDPHWTDSHIRFEENDEKFIAYDEAGLEHSRWDTLNEARDVLVLYAAHELHLPPAVCFPLPKHEE